MGGQCSLAIASFPGLPLSRTAREEEKKKKKKNKRLFFFFFAYFSSFSSSLPPVRYVRGRPGNEASLAMYHNYHYKKQSAYTAITAKNHQKNSSSYH